MWRVQAKVVVNRSLNDELAVFAALVVVSHLERHFRIVIGRRGASWGEGWGSVAFTLDNL